MKYSEEIKHRELSVALPANLHKEITKALSIKNGEPLAIAGAYKPSEGLTRFTCLIYKVLIPEPGQDNIDFLKSVSGLFTHEEAGIVLIGEETVIRDLLENTHYAVIREATKFPIALLIVHSDMVLKARVQVAENEFKEAATVRVVGKKLTVHHDGTSRIKPEFKEIYKRTVTVWGKENHDHIARLRVGVIGLGSVGSIVVESLARMGIERFVLVDFDEVQLHNLDRLLGASIQDLGTPKVAIAERQSRLASTATNVEVVSVIGGVTEEQGYRQALDCDIIFSCVDRPWPRYVLNNLAYNHLIPVIDGGIQVRLNPETLAFEGADWQLQSVGPDRPCLECLGTYTPAHVTMEKQGILEDPTYLAGLPEDHEFKRNENIFPFSLNLASLEVMQFIEQVTGIGHTHYYGTQRFSYNEGYIRLSDERKCQQSCFFKDGIAQGDTLFPPPIGSDLTAKLARDRQNNDGKL